MINKKKEKVKCVPMKYYPKEVYYEVRDGIKYIILDYGDSKTEHAITAQRGARADEPSCNCESCNSMLLPHES